MDEGLVLVVSGAASIVMVVGVFILGDDVDPRPGDDNSEGDALNVNLNCSFPRT